MRQVLDIAYIVCLGRDGILPWLYSFLFFARFARIESIGVAVCERPGGHIALCTVWITTAPKTSRINGLYQIHPYGHIYGGFIFIIPCGFGALMKGFGPIRHKWSESAIRNAGNFRTYRPQLSGSAAADPVPSRSGPAWRPQGLRPKAHQSTKHDR